MRDRIRVYNEQTAPLVDFYAAKQGAGLKYVRVDGRGDVESIQAAIGNALQV